jgi:hypothetical protein
VSKKSKATIKPGVKGSRQNVQQSLAKNTPGKTDGKNQFGGSELFSFFTANIIKEEKVFTR